MGFLISGSLSLSRVGVGVSVVVEVGAGSWLVGSSWTAGAAIELAACPAFESVFLAGFCSCSFLLVILALAALSLSLTLTKLDAIALGTSFEDIRFASRSLCLGWPTGILGLPNDFRISDSIRCFVVVLKSCALLLLTVVVIQLQLLLLLYASIRRRLIFCVVLLVEAGVLEAGRGFVAFVASLVVFKMIVSLADMVFSVLLPVQA